MYAVGVGVAWCVWYYVAWVCIFVVVECRCDVVCVCSRCGIMYGTYVCACACGTRACGCAGVSADVHLQPCFITVCLIPLS